MFGPGASPDDAVRSARALSDDDLHHLAEVVRRVQVGRAIDNGDHFVGVDRVVSYEVRGGELVEVSQRTVPSANMRRKPPKPCTESRPAGRSAQVSGWIEP